MTEHQFKICSRLAKTPEGAEFLEEILRPMQSDNYRHLLDNGKDHRDETIGFGCCLATLVDLLTNCDRRLTEQQVKPPEGGWA